MAMMVFLTAVVSEGWQGVGDMGGGITFDEVPDCEACPAECLKNQYFIENFRNVKTRSRISWIIH